MQTGHMTDSTAHESSGQRMPEVGADMRNERASRFDGWVLTSGQRDEADASDTTADTHSLIAARQFNLTKHSELDGRPIHHLLAHVTDEELAGFRFACAEAARTELEVTNPLVAFKHYRAALHHFPFLPGLDVLRAKLVASARQAIEASLQSANDSLKDRHTWKTAGRALAHADALIEAEDTLRAEFASRHALLESVHSRVMQLTLKGQHKLDPSDEHALLRDLRDEMADDLQSYWHMPGWRSVRERLDRLDAAARNTRNIALFEARRRLLAEIHQAYNDVSASAFIERYVQGGNAPPLDETIVQLQLDETNALLSRANELLHNHEADKTDAPALLHDGINKLEAWQRDLCALISAMSIAQHRATLGLRDPEQLDVARYVLGVGGRKPTTALHQAPAMFVGHPSLLRCKAFVDQCAARRRTQERLLREVTLCLRFDAAITPDEITSASHGDEHFIHTLQSHLHTRGMYPIELAWDKLREVARDEPDDACGLQATLVYRDSDDYGNEVRSLPAIMAVVQCKVRQIRVLREWLANAMRFSDDAHWEREKNAIQILRDSGPAGLTEAQVRCRAARSGHDAGDSMGAPALAQRCRALSPEAMTAHLRQHLREADPEAANTPLCAPARAINQQRHALWLDCDRQLRECDQLAADIASRIERYSVAWDAFAHSYRALMELPSLRRNRAAESAEWQAFQRAAEQFCDICPNYPVFQAKLSDVQARFKLEPECLGGRHA